MFIKLSDKLYVNTERITSIVPRMGNAEDGQKWTVHFDEGALILSDVQFKQMIACMHVTDGTK